MRRARGAGVLVAAALVGCGDGGPPPPVPGGGGSSLPGPPPMSAPGSGSAPSAPATPDAEGRVTIAGGLTYVVPAGWTDLGAAGMRAAQYDLPAAAGDSAAPQLRVFYFGPGQGGPVAENLDRWSGQFAAQPAAPVIAQQPANGLTVHTLDVRGTFNDAMGGGGPSGAGCRMLAAIVVAPDGDKWFFKLVGYDAGVAAAEPGFRALCADVRRK